MSDHESKIISGPARWSRRHDDIPRILPRRTVAGQPDISSDEGVENYQFHVLVIDPQPLTRNCLVAAMKGASNLASIAAVASVEETRGLMERGAVFDAAIYNLDRSPVDERALPDLLMPMMAALMDTPLMVLASSTAPACLNTAMQHGVRGFLASDTTLSVVLQAIRLICTGWMLYPAFRHGDTFQAQPKFAARGDSDAVKLTPRQEEVLKCLATGMPNKSIAFHLKMSESTVKAHIKEIMQRVGAANRTQVVALIGKNEDQDL